MSNQPETVVSGTRVRRRRTRRHHRNRRIRQALIVCACAVFTFGFASVALRHLSPSLFKSSRDSEPTRQSAEASRNLFIAAQQAALHEFEDRPVYRYSIVPGGVKDARELKWVAEHDPVVAAHYAGFDYDHARVVRLVLARTAYLSYRIGNKVYWTRHRVSLKKGETVITDGRMTARTRCANRVEEVPQQGTSESEPSAAQFEEPIQPLAGTAMAAPPGPFESSLANRQPVPGLGPAPPLSQYDPLGGGGPFVPISMPPLPSVCGVGTKKPKGAVGSEVEAAVGRGKTKKGDPCSTGGMVETPEPGTWLLVASGLAFMYWRGRQRFVRT